MPYLPEAPATWPRKLYEQAGNANVSEPYQYFLRTISRIDILPEHAKGKIAVIGQGPLFPERTLFCSGRFFDHLRGEVELLATFDTAFLSSPAHWLEDAKVEFGTPDVDIRALSRGTVLSYGWGFQYVVGDYHLPGNVFDTVFAFQIQNLGQQLREGLIESIAHVLVPGGHFIGSGGVAGNFYEEYAKQPNRPLQMRQEVRLPNPGAAGSFNDHIGVIFQKASSHV